MDNEMIERCESAINKLQDTGEVIGVKQVVIQVIKSMRDPTEKMVEHGCIGVKAADWRYMIDVIIGDK